MKDQIQKFFKGEVLDDEATLKTYSKDASLFVVRPKLVVFPKDALDLENLVKWVSENKAEDPTLSLTIRAAGSDMSGGPLNESIIADVTKHMGKIGEINERGTVVEPGAFYRDFEVKTLEKGLILPCYPASKNLCALGGQIANNGAGEKTLRYGKMENFVVETKMIFADGKEYRVKALSKDELDDKIYQGGFEGGVYEKLYDLILKNYELIQNAKPKVSKNSAGYYLWNVWKDGIFDLNKLIVGSQGTLGVITEAKIKLVPVEPISRLFVIFLKDLEPLASVVNEILPTNPESIECFDDASMKLAVRFLPKYILRFLPEAFMILRGGVPKLIMLVEYSGKTEEEVGEKLKALEEKIKHFGLQMHRAHSESESEKYWTMRRESFNLLRKHIKNARTAPFVDDVVVGPEDMPSFLPKMRAILDSYKLNYTIAGHAGDGNFHVIPLMNMKNRSNVQVIKEVGEKIYDLVGKYHGSITGEHNDGIVRTPYLNKMYSREVLDLFKKTKEIFDPQNIFNPGKKVGGTVDYLTSHIAIE
ncbi:FAD-binding oxidoreductase [Candidatus Parcubacteria bacterium]|nr:FAD-binding oxidoreductase [Candidatus Parcubacteria bacterium]